MRLYGIARTSPIIPSKLVAFGMAPHESPIAATLAACAETHSFKSGEQP